MAEFENSVHTSHVVKISDKVRKSTSEEGKKKKRERE